MPIAHLGLGGSEADAAEVLRSAVRTLDADPGTRVVAVSRLYRSAPIGRAVGRFVNAAATVEHDGTPATLLRLCQKIERSHGRVASARWDDRPLDIDILLADFESDTDELRVPHPLLAVRRFALDPLAEIAADAVHSRLGVSVGRLAEHWRKPGLRVRFEAGVPPVEDDRIQQGDEDCHLVLTRVDHAAGWPPAVDLRTIPLDGVRRQRDAVLAGVLDPPTQFAAF